MLRIVDVTEAERTILRRQPSGEEIPEALRAGLRRVFGEDITPQQGVRRIVSDVRQRGDEALRYWTETIDRRHLDSFAISPQEWAAALARLPGDLQASLHVAAQRIRAFHARQPIPPGQPPSWWVLGRRSHRSTAWASMCRVARRRCHHRF
jgi:histidinol dehydrogenase